MKKWIMLTVCSAIFFAANAQQAPAQNPSQATVQSERHVHSGKKENRTKQEPKSVRRNQQLRMRRHVMRNRANRRYGRNHFRNRRFNRTHSSHGK